MMFISVIIGIFSGRIDEVAEAAINMPKTAVEISISLIRIMALWLGIMKIAEKSGLILIISKVVKTITIRLFPDVPPGIGATMYGSSETTFYVLVVYFGSVGVVRGRHAIPAGLIGDLVGAIAAVFLCKLLLT